MKNKGITLTTLVITIIILLMLIGTTVMIIIPSMGELLSKSNETKEQARALSVKQARDEWFTEIKVTTQMRNTV